MQPLFIRRVFLGLLVGLTATLCGCVGMGGWQTVRGNGNVVKDERIVAGFDRVSVSGAGELELTQGKEEGLTIEADDNLLPYIRSEVSNGRLLIGPERVNLNPTGTIRYHLQLKNLSRLELSGSLHAQADTLKTGALAVDISGSGRFRLRDLTADRFTVHISGSGNVSVGGRVQRQELRISGSGDLHASELQSAVAEIHISGSGSAVISVSDALKAHISGSGHVDFQGNPSLDSHISGSGHVRHVAGLR